MEQKSLPSWGLHFDFCFKRIILEASVRRKDEGGKSESGEERPGGPEAKTIPGCQALLCQQGSAFPRAAPFEVMQRRIQSPALWSEDLK